MTARGGTIKSKLATVTVAASLVDLCLHNQEKLGGYPYPAPFYANRNGQAAVQQPAILATAAHHLIHLEQRVGHPFGNSAAIYAGNQPYHRTKHFSVDDKQTVIPILH